MPSSISEPSIITLEKPERMADMQTAGDWPWSWCMTTGMCGIGFDGGLDQVTQEMFAGVFAGTG